MTGEVLGGGVMVLVAAVLWVAYLVPSWSRRKQYLATERNAVRLQQTLRVLAETAEVPQHVRLEVNARTVLDQQKRLAQADADARADAKAQVAAAAEVRRAAAALAAAARPPVLVTAAERRRRGRRARALGALVLLVGVLATLVGIVTVALTGAWPMLVFGLLATTLAVNTLARRARTQRAARPPAALPEQPAEPRVRPVMAPFEPVHIEQTPIPAVTWTPRTLPSPLHLSRGSIAQAAMASVEASNQLRQAAVDADRERRNVPLVDPTTAPVIPIARPAARQVPVAGTAPVAAPTPEAAPLSRFAAMGIVGETEPGMTDLDDVLRRRRRVG
ncbi:MAG: hypothetical protein R6W83_08495 [Cryobacterium sp.]